MQTYFAPHYVTWHLNLRSPGTDLKTKIQVQVIYMEDGSREVGLLHRKRMAVGFPDKYTMLIKVEFRINYQ